MKYGNHKWGSVYTVKFQKKDNNWICKKCSLDMFKPYAKPLIWRVGKGKYIDTRDIKAPLSCEAVFMNEALE